MSSSSKKARIDPQVTSGEGEGEPEVELGDDNGGRRVAVAPNPVDNTRKIWLNVFEKLATKDKVTFLATTPECHEWVASQRPVILFHEIAPILLEKLPIPLSLQCRQLSRQWTQKLAEQHQSHPDQLRFTFEKEGIIDGPQLPKYITRFEAIEQVEKFIEDFRTHPGNPFPGRTIILMWKELPGNMSQPGYLKSFKEYWNKLGQLLLQFGSHVHFAIIHCWEHIFETHLLEGFGVIRNYLVDLPNLKRLKIVGTSRASLTLKNMRKFLKTKPLPRLEDLETLELWGMNPVLMNAIFNCCPVPSNLKRLCFDITADGYGDDDEVDLFEMIEKFTNLEVLELANLCTGDFVRFSELTSLTRLTHLNLGFWKDDLEAKPFFDGLEPFGRSLTHLKMKSGLLVSLPAKTRINLPHLVRLDLKIYEGQLDPLAELTTLTFLRIEKVIQRKRDKKRNIESVIDVYGFEKRMYQSNIWNVMPTLQTIIIGKKTYERQIYERLQNSK